MAAGAMQELIIDAGAWSAALNGGYAGESSWGTASATPLYGKMMVFEDGYNVDIQNQTIKSMYKKGSLNAPEVRRVGADVTGPSNIHLFPDFARFVLDMCNTRDTNEELRSYTHYFNTPLGAANEGYRETRKILGAKVNTWTLTAGDDSQELMCNMEWIAKSCNYLGVDWARDQYTPKDAYLFIDGGMYFRTYDLSAAWDCPMSPFSPWSPSPQANWFKSTIASFSIEGNNNLTAGPKKRDPGSATGSWITSLLAGTAEISGSFSIDYNNSIVDQFLLERFANGELVLNFMRPGSTGYTVTTDAMGVSAKVITVATGDGSNFVAGDVVLLMGTIDGVEASEVFTVKSVSTDDITVYTYGDTLDGWCPFMPGMGFRHDWTNSAGTKLYNHALQIWIPTFKVTDSPKTGAPSETQKRAVNFEVSEPDITDGFNVDTSSEYKQIQYQAPGSLNPADRASDYFIDPSIS